MASQSKAWLCLAGIVRFTSGLEEVHVDMGMARRARRKARRQAQAEAVRRPTQCWVVEHQAGVDGLREAGISEAEAHTKMAWVAGERWARQPGDSNYYGYPDCRAYDQDGLCSMCSFVDTYNSTPRELMIPPINWVNEEDDNRWGTREW